MPSRRSRSRQGYRIDDMLPEQLRMKSPSDEIPPQDTSLMIEAKGTRAQCEIRGDTAFCWGSVYPEGPATKEFCKVSEISGWRGCTGFDF